MWPSPAPRLPPSRRRARRRRIVAALAISVAGAVLAVSLDAAPTGLALADAAYRGAYVAGVAMACATARRWTWPIVAGTAAVAGLHGVPLVLGGLALVVAAAAQLDRRRRQPVGAVVGALSALALLQLPSIVAFGMPSLVAALAPVPAVASALGTMRARVRRPVLLAAGAVAAVGVLVLVAFGTGVLLLRSDADRGVDSARAGLDALRRGEQRAAARHFAVAARSFDDAHNVSTSWWMTPAKAVPVLGQHLDVARALTDEGGRLARVSADTAPAVSLDDLATPAGAFRLDRIAELEPLAADVVDALERARRRLGRVSDDWLTGPMVGAVDHLREEIATSQPDAELAVEALAVAPDLLGADTAKRYVVLFGNPAEARALGGFVASMGMLTAHEGALAFESLPNPYDLERQLAAAGALLQVDVPAGFANAQPQRYVRTWTDSADIATVTDVVADLYPQLPGAGHVDGVLYADPYVLAALLELTGPVDIPGSGHRIDAGTAAEYLLRGQYLDERFEPGAERKERLGDAGEAAFDRLLAGGLPRPRRLAELLSPLVRARRLLFSTTDPAAHEVLARVGLRPRLAAGRGETVVVSHGNRRANKLDAFLERAIRYDARVDVDGTVEATLTVSLTDTAPAGLVPYQTGTPRAGEALGTHAVTLDVHTGFHETAVLVAGAPAPYNDLEAGDLQHTAIPVTVPPGETVVVEVRLIGRIAPAACAFSFVPNAGAGIDTLDVRIDAPQAQLRERRRLDHPVTLGCGGSGDDS